MTVYLGGGAGGGGGGGGGGRGTDSRRAFSGVLRQRPWWRSGEKQTRTKVYPNSISPKQPPKFLAQYGFVQASCICVNLKNNPCPIPTDGILSHGGKIWCLTLLYDLAISQSVNSGNFQSCKALCTFQSRRRNQVWQGQKRELQTCGNFCEGCKNQWHEPLGTTSLQTKTSWD